ncbi:DUF1648 domain-containing protein [Microtetraspora sp. NBRC 16547]|uniref:DUF1648 domain-containing protein n=1 Tax=Microtetraspora sp. NBRC 16547 TaxID=3030993 RepID=UPI0024A0C79E|nr:DUF1648 domain-containing protein [Microtetraspora sp. NBRC 16547]GLW97120.1 hypothetical protein Misp02_12070 [Microtetraspora sp. NBRC 16547]
MNTPPAREGSFRTRFLLVAGAWVVLVSAALAAVPLGFRGRLPDPLAAHWGPSGDPDGSMPFAAFVLVALLWAVVAGTCLGAAARGRLVMRRAGRRSVAAGLGWGAAFLLGLQTVTISANLDRARWEDAASLGWQVAAVIAAAFLVGGLGWLAGRPGPDERPAGAEPRPTALVLHPGERPVWVSTVASPLVAGLAFALLAAAVSLAACVLMGFSAALWIGVVVFAFVGLLGLGLSSVRVKVSPEGLTVSYGPLRWPSRSVPLGRLDRAWTEQRFPSDVGGWGYRGLPGQSTIMIRGGECLVVRYTSGGELGISVDDAAQGAALLNALVASRD